MSVRYKRKRRCVNCPETVEGLPVHVASVPTTYVGEGRELWKVVLVACGTLTELLFRYVVLHVPGQPVEQLERLHKRLGEVIEARKERENVENSSPSDIVSDGSDNGSASGWIDSEFTPRR